MAALTGGRTHQQRRQHQHWPRQQRECRMSQRWPAAEAAAPASSTTADGQQQKQQCQPAGVPAARQQQSAIRLTSGRNGSIGSMTVAQRVYIRHSSGQCCHCSCLPLGRGWPYGCCFTNIKHVGRAQQVHMAAHSSQELVLKPPGWLDVLCGQCSTRCSLLGRCC